jgi:hypothetical protein
VKLRDTLQLLLLSLLGSALASALLLQVQMLTVPSDVAATNCSGLHKGTNDNTCSLAFAIPTQVGGYEDKQYDVDLGVCLQPCICALCNYSCRPKRTIKHWTLTLHGSKHTPSPAV